MATAGERNNNPGCIMGKGGLRKFSTLEEGYQALNSLLYRKYNNRTCFEIFKQYAPYSDGNNPKKYANFVINELNKKGISVDESSILDLSNPYILQELTLAISKMENGKVLGGAAFARNCSVAFAHKKGLSTQKPVQMASISTTATENYLSTLTQSKAVAPQTEVTVNAEQPDLIENLKKNQAKYEQSLTKNEQPEKKSNINIMKLLIQATAALLTRNSALSGPVAQIIEAAMSEKNETSLAATKKDNQNA